MPLQKKSVDEILKIRHCKELAKKLQVWNEAKANPKNKGITSINGMIQTIEKEQSDLGCPPSK